MTDSLSAALVFVVTSIVVAATLPGAVELLVLTIGSLLPPRRRAARIAPPRRLMVLVPAHDEAAYVQRCIASLQACTAGEVDVSIVVVADNCSDDTAALARAAGARVLERRDAQRRGKGWALAFGFEALLAPGIDAVAIVDADSVVEPNFIAELCRLFSAGADAVQVHYGVLNPERSRRARLLHVALLAINLVRPRGRDRCGLSAGIMGNGFALSRATLQAVPYTARSLVEDVEYHLQLVRAGKQVWFSDRTAVRAEMPVTGLAVQTQRARWEGGRLRLLLDRGPELARAILGGQWRQAEPLADLLLLPLAWHCLLLAAALPFTPIYALAGLAVVGAHIAAALILGGAGWRELAAVLSAPAYLLWKMTRLAAIARAARRTAPWTRTERRPPADRRT